jgi:hypothetical protein
MNTPIGGPFDCYPPRYWPLRETAADFRTIQVMPNVQEEMGIDPISKLAAAIEKLAAALEETKK